MQTIALIRRRQWRHCRLWDISLIRGWSRHSCRPVQRTASSAEEFEWAMKNRLHDHFTVLKLNPSIAIRTTDRPIAVGLAPAPNSFLFYFQCAPNFLFLFLHVRKSEISWFTCSFHRSVRPIDGSHRPESRQVNSYLYCSIFEKTDM